MTTTQAVERIGRLGDQGCKKALLWLMLSRDPQHRKALERALAAAEKYTAE
jgi:hypothetical protein